MGETQEYKTQIRKNPSKVLGVTVYEVLLQRLIWIGVSGGT